jgi:GNAT superfamily N-acetyltransferase
MGKIEVVEATASEVEELALVHAAVDRELTPDLPPIGADELALTLFQFPDRRPQRTWLARLDGVPAGSLKMMLPATSNITHAEPYVMVAPDQRRRGVATVLLRTALAEVAAGRDLVSAWVDSAAGGLLSERIGLTNRQDIRNGRLVVADLDVEQQRRWIDDAPGRAAGYRIVSWRGPAPEDLISEVCAAFDAMADTPLDDLDFDIATTTPEMIRDVERASAGRVVLFGSLALSGDGEPAGITELEVNVHRPVTAQQGDTAVVPAHRGHGLGRWLKAANLAQVIAAHPGLRFVTTYNAATNPHMLAINDEMGFRPYKSFRAYQGDLATARHALDTLQLANR